MDGWTKTLLNLPILQEFGTQTCFEREQIGDSREVNYARHVDGQRHYRTDQHHCWNLEFMVVLKEGQKRVLACELHEK